jgi:phosphotransferase system HPr (HPr) family protein
VATHVVSAVVPDEVVLSARPAALFVQQAAGFASAIELSCGAQRADGKSILGIQQIGATAVNAVDVRAGGEDAEQAAATLAAYIRAIASRRSTGRVAFARARFVSGLGPQR